MRKILILDKDGTLTIPKSGAKFVQSSDDQKIIPGAGKAVTYAKAEGYSIAIASNQLGIEYGYKSDRDAIKEFDYLHSFFPEIDFSVWCPDKGESIGVLEANGGVSSYHLIKWGDRSPLSTMARFRKPDPGMLQYILAKYGCNKIMANDKILYVGDRPEDEQAAINARVKFVWADVFRTDYQRFL